MDNNLNQIKTEIYDKCALVISNFKLEPESKEDTPVFELDYELSQIEELAKENVAQRVIVTGVQPKLSLGLTN